MKENLKGLIDILCSNIYNYENSDLVEEGLTYVIGPDKATVIAPNGATIFEYKFGEDINQ